MHIITITIYRINDLGFHAFVMYGVDENVRYFYVSSHFVVVVLTVVDIIIIKIFPIHICIIVAVVVVIPRNLNCSGYAFFCNI